ncbi:MAG TPA: hypothetical protein VFY48_02915 [Solirubrobacterales bacterium]|nr:hypothetical protein [Solirubrobacterales bacterium]
MQKHTGWALGIACTLALLLAPAARAACPDEALRAAAPSLPGCLAVEMVSPVRKYSQPAILPSFSRDGGRLLVTIQTALADTPGYQYYGGDRYVATRGAAGWAIASTSPRDPLLIGGGARWGGPATFTPDLSRWTQFGATQQQIQIGTSRLFGGGLDGSFEPLSPLLAPIDNSGSPLIQFAVVNALLDGSSTALTTSVLRPTLPSTAFLAGDPTSETTIGGLRNSYVVNSGLGSEPIELLARDKDGAVFGGRCGTFLGGDDAIFNQGAISPDGQRIFFSTRPNQPWDPEAEEEPPCNSANPLRVMQRTMTSEGPVIAEIAPGGGGPSAAGDDLFQGASADASKVYFTSPRKLTGSDVDASADPCFFTLGTSKGCDLYLYDESRPEGDRIVHVSAGDGPGPADVLNSITAISGDGSRAYFVAQHPLNADLNPEGAAAQDEQPNLYLFEAGTGELSFIATLAAEDGGGLWGKKGSFYGDAYAVPLYGPDLEGGGDGHILAFASKAPITSEDGDGGAKDVFRYDAVADTIERISKAAEGGSDNGGFDVDVNPAIAEILEYNFGEATRWASEDGQMIAFATAEPLLPGDSDEAVNPYIWDEGELGAVFGPVSEPPAVAPVGEQFVFATTAALLPRDGDLAQDAYVAREGGGFPEPVAPPACDPLVEGSCRGAASTKPPPAPSPPTGPSGNLTQPPKKCKKGQVKRKGKCEKRGKAKPDKQAATKRGGNR